ncbi:MAG: DoxX family protein [Pirellulales bacterium]|nr:DoxX family protein [Pirellulales bacterium]
MTIDSRRVLGGFAVFAIVLLRLVIGWHFFGEGAKKLEYDRHAGQFRMVFSADEFFAQAKGPLAPVFLGYTPSGHEWRALLASPREHVPPTPEQAAESAKWVKEYARRRSDAEKKGEAAPIEFVPGGAASEWGAKVVEDWRAAVERFKGIPGLTDAQEQQCDQLLAQRLVQLNEYLAGEEAAIAEYRHELWRLANWRKLPEAGDVPYYSKRVATKAGETAAQAAGWREQVRIFEDALHQDLLGLLTDEQRAKPEEMTVANAALADANQAKLDCINKVATVLTLGVGLCLIFGFVTRLASLAGALFLLGVIVSQPFWAAGAVPTINQCVELSGLLVLAGTGAGRWAGIDGCLAALFGRIRRMNVVEN